MSIVHIDVPRAYVYAETCRHENAKLPADDQEGE